jgi:hypothetical protein
VTAVFSDLRILSYNTQLRSWMMELNGFPPNIPPTYTAPTRAKLIAANILASANDYDLVCLNEIFDETARGILSAELRAKYPYQVTKADLLYTRLVQPGFADDLGNAVFDAAFEPLLDVASLFALKFEDSGLFLASRFPFAKIPLTQAIVDALGPDAVLFPDGLVQVSFMTYSDCSGGDCRASKGVLHARVQQNPTLAVDIFMTHTQADDESVGENATERGLQVAAAWQFIKARVGPPPFAHPTFYVGDLNIVGGLADDPPSNDTAEWTALFNTPGQPFTDHLVDQWGQIQCRGGGSGLNDPGFSADVRYPPLRQRLDQFVGSAAPYVLQHVRIDWPLAAAPPGIDGVPRLSDHRPLGIHLGRQHPHANCADALPLNLPDDRDDDRLIGPGEVMWYRFDERGTYEFRLILNDPSVYFEVYQGSDLSTPQPQYRNEEHPDFGKRFVLLAPFFVKVGNHRRDREFVYSFRSHRHQGIDPFDAIHLIPGVDYPENFPPQQLNGDSFVTPWPDEDTKFFLVETPRIPTNRPISLSVDLASDSPVLVGLTVAEWDKPNSPVMLDDGGFGAAPRRVQWQGKPGQTFLVSATRRDGAFPAMGYVLTAQIDISLFIGGTKGNPVLVCTEETSGWGSDDIALELSSDTGWARSVSNDEIGDFDQDDPRDLWTYIPDLVSYETGFTVSVIEEDDIDDNDVGTQVIPPFDNVKAWAQWRPIGPDLPHQITGGITIDVDDGTYTLNCTLAKWDPRI